VPINSPTKKERRRGFLHFYAEGQTETLYREEGQVTAKCACTDLRKFITLEAGEKKKDGGVEK